MAEQVQLVLLLYLYELTIQCLNHFHKKVVTLAPPHKLLRGTLYARKLFHHKINVFSRQLSSSSNIFLFLFFIIHLFLVRYDIYRVKHIDNINFTIKENM